MNCKTNYSWSKCDNSFSNRRTPYHQDAIGFIRRSSCPLTFQHSNTSCHRDVATCHKSQEELGRSVRHTRSLKNFSVYSEVHVWVFRCLGETLNHSKNTQNPRIPDFQFLFPLDFGGLPNQARALQSVSISLSNSISCQ